ncbi:MAG: lipopolysaccharide heptosyltransferase II [Bacteroidota bacterium]
MKILVIQTAFIGDLIMTTPIYRALREVFPKAQIDTLVIPQSSIILKYNPYIDNIHTFDKKNGFARKIYSFFRIVYQLRKEKYDIGISVQSSYTSAFILLLSGIVRRIGYRRLPFATDKVLLPKGLHNRLRVLKLLEPLSNNTFSDSTEIFLSESEVLKAREIIQKYSNHKNRKIAIAPGSVWETKKWSSEYYAELTNLLRSDNVDVFFIGSKQETELCEKIISHSRNQNAYNFAGKLNLLESAALIAEMDLLICNDSSPLHIANAVGTDVFAFFGPTVRQFGCFPYRQNDKILEVALECRPCSKHGGRRCPLGHHNCMKLIKPEYVHQLITEKFANSLPKT